MGNYVRVAAINGARQAVEQQTIEVVNERKTEIHEGSLHCHKLNGARSFGG